MEKSRLIHKFNALGQYVVMDIESGAVHVVAPIVYDLIDAYAAGDKASAMEALANEYDRDDLEEAWQEIVTLEEEGLLFTAYEPMTWTYNPKNIIKAMCLHVAHDCNLRCRYCFASQGDFHGERSIMSLDVGKQALRFLAENSGNRYHLEVDFFGGEPLMNFDVVKELVAYGRKLESEYDKKFRFTITTNGMLLDDEIMDFINEHMDNVVLSLDGRREVNDAMRPTVNGKGSFDIIVPKYQEFIERRGDKEYYVRGTFTSDNLDFSEDVKAYYDLGFKLVSMEPVVTDPKEPYAITEEDLPQILEEYEKLAKFYGEVRKTDKEFLFFHYMIDLTQGPCIIKRSVGCGAGSEYIAVTPEGDIYPCHQFVGEEGFKMGNVFDGIENTALREEFKSSSIVSKDECSRCWAKYFCSGGCHANAWYSHGDIKKPYELGCEMEKSRLEYAIALKAIESFE